MNTKNEVLKDLYGNTTTAHGGSHDATELDENMMRLIDEQFEVYEDGTVINRKTGNTMSAKEGYVRLWVKLPEGGNKCLLTHRVVYTKFVGPIAKGVVVDHKDCDKQNNAVSNLRLLTHSDNLRNQKTAKKGSKGYTTVIGTSLRNDLKKDGTFKTYPYSASKAVNGKFWQFGVDNEHDQLTLQLALNNGLNPTLAHPVFKRTKNVDATLTACGFEKPTLVEVHEALCTAFADRPELLQIRLNYRDRGLAGLMDI